MVVIPPKDEILVKIFRCPICGGIYQAQTGRIQMKCSVLHSPGSCCHCHEKKVTGLQLSQVQAILRGECK